MPIPPELMTEYDIQCAIFRRVDLYSKDCKELLLLTGSLNGIRLHPGSIMKAKRAGCLNKGFPDLLLPVPKKGKHGLFIELKTEKGRTSNEQKAWLNVLNAFGYKAEVAHGLEEAWEILTDYLEIGDCMGRG